MNLSPHFVLREFEVTSTGIANHVPENRIPRLMCLCSAVLEPLRERVGPIKITSGFRSRAVNEAVGGSSTSDHPRARAADVIPLGAPRDEVWALLLRWVAEWMPVDQAIIYEDKPHLHLSHRTHMTNRRELKVHLDDGSYVDWADYDGRLRT